MEAGERPQTARCGRRTDILLSIPRLKVVALGYNQYAMRPSRSHLRRDLAAHREMHPYLRALARFSSGARGSESFFERSGTLSTRPAPTSSSTPTTPI